MRAVLLEAAGLPPVLRDADLPTPEPGPGEALVRVAACGFSHHDALIIEGTLRRGVTLPRVLGHEAAGEVVAVGEGAPPELVGASVVLLPGDVGHRRDGAFAELLTAPADALVVLPDAADARSALLASPVGVAVKAVDVCRLRPGATLIVAGASGGVGLHAAQVAAAAGAVVVGVAGSPAKGAALEAMSCFAAVALDADPWEEVAAALTGDAGADAALDATGLALPRLARALRRGGRLALVGQVARGDAPFPVAEAIFRELAVVGSLGAEREHVERAAQLVADGAVAPVVDEELRLSAASVAHALRRVKAREVVGRVVLRPPR